MALVLVTNGWDFCTYPYNGGQRCFLLGIVDLAKGYFLGGVY